MSENIEEKIMEVVRARIRIDQLEDDLRKAGLEYRYLVGGLHEDEFQKYRKIYRESQL